jgi:hypothetical protein
MGTSKLWTPERELWSPDQNTADAFEGETYSPEMQEMMADWLGMQSALAKKGVQQPFLPPHMVLRYERRPDLYVAEVLGKSWTESQCAIAYSLLKRRKTLVTSGHSLGKSHLAGGLVNWFYDTFTQSITITTAPSQGAVEDVLWREVRLQRGNRPGLKPSAPRMETGEDHFAVGYTAARGGSFQGRKSRWLLVIFDEAVDIDALFWQGARGMLAAGEWNLWLALMNPTDTTSQAYAEFSSGAWDHITLSVLDHPNIRAGLEGRPDPFPGAVTLQWLVEEAMPAWCEAISSSDKRRDLDFEFPPGSDLWYRPSSEGEARILGRWPTAGSTSIWSQGLWDMCEKNRRPIPREPLILGCDVAREGDDYTSIVARRGPCAIHHETHNGWKTDRIALELKDLIQRLVEVGEDPRSVEVRVDDDGVGGGVVDQADDYEFIPIGGGERPNDRRRYANRRSEVWFEVQSFAQEEQVDVTRLSRASRHLIKTQLMAPRWEVNSGRRQVEDKKLTKKRLKRSPDDGDSFNLCYCSAGTELWFG